MDAGWIVNNIGAIIGAFVVLVVAFFVFRSKSNNNQSQKDGKESISKVGRQNGDEEATTLPQESVSDKQTSPIWKTRRYILNKIRSLKKPDILPVKKREYDVQAADNQEERIPSRVDTPVADEYRVQIEIQEENPENVSDVEVPDEDTPEIPVPVTTDDSDTVSSETENNQANESTDDIDSLEIDLNAVSPTDETEEIDSTQLEDTAINNENLSEKPKKGGDVFSLFAEEDEEENEVSKFAANLDQVDINELLTNVENIQKNIRR